MDAAQKEAITKFIALYHLPREQEAAAAEFILPAAMLLKSYLHRLDLPQPLYPIAAQLAIAQQVAGGLIAEVSSSSSQSSGESSKEAGIKSISEGSATVTFETGGEEKKNAVSNAMSSKIALSPAQVLEENKAILNRYRRGVVLP